MRCPACNSIKALALKTETSGVWQIKCACGHNGPMDYRTTTTSKAAPVGTIVNGIVKARAELQAARAALRKEMGPELFPEDGMNTSEIWKRLQEDPESVSKEDRHAAALDIARSLQPTAMEIERTRHPGMSLIEIAKRAETSALDAAYQLHPELAQPARSQTTLRKRAGLQIEKARLEEQIAAIAKSHLARGLSATAAQDRALRSDAYVEYRKLMDQIDSLEVA